MDSKIQTLEIDSQKDFVSKSEAMKYEKWLKTGVGRLFIRSLPM